MGRMSYSLGICIVFSLGLLFSQNSNAADFTVKSSSITSGEVISTAQVYNGFGCTGKNISPDLEWSNPPPNTKSFAVTVFDPDAPTGSGWWHWVVFNIPPSVKNLPADAGEIKAKLMPKGATQSKTDFGTFGYGGPCPPKGDKPHHYYFRVYALKATLPLTSSTPAAQVGYYINQNKLAEAELIGVYSR